MALLDISVLGLTSGPGGGKSQIAEALQNRWPNDVVVVHEAATILLSGGFPPPGEHADVQGVMPFQKAVHRVTCSLEELAAQRARLEGKRLIVTDRGRLGGAAYLAIEGDKLTYFARELGIDVGAELAVYDEVVHLESLAVQFPEAYERMRHSDKTFRMESAPEARKRDEDIRAIWSLHPRHHVIPADVDSLQPKIDAVTAIAARMMGIEL
jgi:predicted ATPase